MKLAARLWLPDDAQTNPVPAFSNTSLIASATARAARDEPMHGYFAGHGYAAIRVDMRGSGESDGLLDDEYLSREHDDALRGDRLDRSRSPGAAARSA